MSAAACTAVGSIINSKKSVPFVNAFFNAGRWRRGLLSESGDGPSLIVEKQSADILFSPMHVKGISLGPSARVNPSELASRASCGGRDPGYA